MLLSKCLLGRVVLMVGFARQRLPSSCFGKDENTLRLEVWILKVDKLFYVSVWYITLINYFDINRKVPTHQMTYLTNPKNSPYCTKCLRTGYKNSCLCSCSRALRPPIPLVCCVAPDDREFRLHTDPKLIPCRWRKLNAENDTNPLMGVVSSWHSCVKRVVGTEKAFD